MTTYQILCPRCGAKLHTTSEQMRFECRPCDYTARLEMPAKPQITRIRKDGRIVGTERRP